MRCPYCGRRVRADPYTAGVRSCAAGHTIPPDVPEVRAWITFRPCKALLRRRGLPEPDTVDVDRPARRPRPELPLESCGGE